MSVRVMTAVWSIDLPDSQKIVLLALADCANDEGHCWPSMATLAKKCSKGERTVQGVIKDLVANGHLTRNEVPGKGCNYLVHPRSGCAPAETAPPQRAIKTPAAAADKPSRTIKPKNTDERGRMISDDWQPTEFGSGSKSAAIVASWDREQFETTVEHFVAHHQAKRTTATDWQPWWKTWVLNSKKFGGNTNGRSQTNRPGNQSPTGQRDGFSRALDQIIFDDRAAGIASPSRQSDDASTARLLPFAPAARAAG